MYLTLITVLDYTNYMYIATPVLKQTTNKVKSHGSNVRNIIIAHMISGDTQTNQLTDAENLKQS